jgi:DNA polymerase III epsilon subunit-like protein
MNKKQEFLNRCISIDTETTSKDYKTCEVIELGYYTDRKVNQLYSPVDRFVPFEVSGITHISTEMISNKPIFSCKELHACLARELNSEVNINGSKVDVSDHFIFVAHNSFYDKNVLERYGLNENCNWLCTLELAKRVYKNNKYFNLPYLRYALETGVDNNFACHRAATDAEITYIVLEKMIDELEKRNILNKNEDYYSQLVEISKSTVLIDEMPFGKHKGKKIKDIPLAYWEWAFQNMDNLNPESEKYDEMLYKSIEHELSSKL